MKTVIMTGGTAGLGKVTARRIGAAPDTELIVGSRAENLDLASLASVRTFAGNLAAPSIDLLILNAGTQQPTNRTRTEDGFETTFAVNHLAHYLLLRLLHPRLSATATVVITTSDTHVTAPKTLDTEALAHPPKGGFAAGFRAYAASKLCNILTARALAEAGPRMTVVAYNPGFTPGTGLQREWPVWARKAAAAGSVLRPVSRLATVDQAGDALADLALGHIAPPDGRVYASMVKRQVTWPDPSALARQDEAMHTLWRESARMTGL